MIQKEYHMNGFFEAPPPPGSSVYNNYTNQTRFGSSSNSLPCSVSMFDEYFFPRCSKTERDMIKHLIEEKSPNFLFQKQHESQDQVSESEEFVDWIEPPLQLYTITTRYLGYANTIVSVSLRIKSKICLKDAPISLSRISDYLDRFRLGGFTAAAMLSSDRGLLCATADQQFFFYSIVENVEESELVLSKRLAGTQQANLALESVQVIMAIS